MSARIGLCQSHATSLEMLTTKKSDDMKNEILREHIEKTLMKEREQLADPQLAGISHLNTWYQGWCEALRYVLQKIDERE